MALSEKIELLGKGLYTDIPDVLTLQSIPTASELDYVGSEDFEKTMLEVILPKAVEEKIDFKQLLEIDFHWLCRCLRILNYGPYFTTSAVYCTECGKLSHGEFRVNFEAIDCKPLPEGFVNDIVIRQDEFIDFKGDVHLQLPTIQKMMNADKDKAFKNSDGETNTELARMCYMITSIKGSKNMTPIEIKMMIQREFSAADYIILKTMVNQMSDYGLRSGGLAPCPKCGKPSAMFMSLTMDKFFRPTLGDLREWKNHRHTGSAKDVSRDASANV
ncbi:MAG: hypothetical protein IJE78_05195 [Bacteroidaceae bacterium]|nr:hypothetical protein [Bacteroidaceae bacterium]